MVQRVGVRPVWTGPSIVLGELAGSAVLVLALWGGAEYPAAIVVAVAVVVALMAAVLVPTVLRWAVQGRNEPTAA